MNQNLIDLTNVIREKFKGEKHRPVSEELSIQLTEDVNPESVIGLIDAGCVIALTLIARGHDPSKIHVIENSKEKCYNEFAKSMAKKMGFNVIEPPIGNLNRIDMKFDVSIGNPPYSGQLHLEFLLSMLKMSDSVRIIHPSGWLTRSDRKIEKEVKKALDGRLKSLKIFNGGPVFNAEFQAPLVITEAVESWDGPIEVTYDNTGNTYEIDSIWDFPTGYWEPTEVNLSLKDLIVEVAKKINLLSLRTSNNNSVPLNLPTICGDPRINKREKLFRDDFYLFFYPNSNIFTHKNNEGRFYSLKTEEERDNLISYLKTKFARFALALNKATNRNNVIRYIENVPLPPLTTKWDDELVYEYYGLNKEQINSIESFIPDYYK